MNRSHTLAPLALCLVLATGACSGGDEPEAKPTKTTASPTPTVPVQPEGEFGVTYDIQNWDDYADNDLVLAYKKGSEAYSASSNRRKLLPAIETTFTKTGRRSILPTMRKAWTNRWTLSAKANVSVVSAKASGSRASVVTCEETPSISYRKASGDFVVPSTSKGWSKTKTKLRKSGPAWKIAAFEAVGSCKKPTGA